MHTAAVLGGINRIKIFRTDVWDSFRTPVGCTFAVTSEMLTPVKIFAPTASIGRDQLRTHIGRIDTRAMGKLYVILAIMIGLNQFCSTCSCRERTTCHAKTMGFANIRKHANHNFDPNSKRNVNPNAYA